MGVFESQDKGVWEYFLSALLISMSVLFEKFANAILWFLVRLLFFVCVYSMLSVSSRILYMWPALDKPPIRRKDWIYVTWVQSSIVIRELRSRALLIASITTECVVLPLCNVRFLYACFQAIVRSRTEPEVLRVQNLHTLSVPRAIEINLRIVRIQKLITLHRKVRLIK